MFALGKRFILAALALMLVTTQAAASAEEELKVFVEKSSDKLVQQLNEERAVYEQDPEAFYASMESALSQFVDFRRIAARVMGRYARQTTPEQRDEFVERFKRSLFDAYARALVDSGEFEMAVTGVEILPNNPSRASVQVLVTTSEGNRYAVTYSMYKKTDAQWLMENVIVEGVNIGLAFRDRFEQSMSQNRGQIQAVIDGWGSAVDSLDLENKVNQS